MAPPVRIILHGTQLLTRDPVVSRNRPPCAQHSHHSCWYQARSSRGSRYTRVIEGEAHGARDIRASLGMRKGDQGLQIPRVLCAHPTKPEERVRRGHSVSNQFLIPQLHVLTRSQSRAQPPTSDHKAEETQVQYPLNYGAVPFRRRRFNDTNDISRFSGHEQRLIWRYKDGLLTHISGALHNCI